MQVFVLKTHFSLSYSCFSTSFIIKRLKPKSYPLHAHFLLMLLQFYMHIAHISLLPISLLQMDHLQLTSLLLSIKILCYVLFIIFTVSLHQTLSIDPKFEACAPNKSCGDGTPLISYPFWIDSEESYCGYPSFKITCKNDQPVLTISEDSFIVKDIFYSNNSVLVANAAAYEEACPTPLRNVSLDSLPFSLSASQLDFFFLYNCSAKPENYLTFPVDCASNDVNKSFAVFHVEELQRNYSLGLCQSVVRSTVIDGFDIYSNWAQVSYTGILKMGFLLDWTAHECSGCESKGGRCGYEDNNFVCFCIDGHQPQTCNLAVTAKKGSGINWKGKLGIAAASTFATITIMLVLGCLYLRRKKTKDASLLLTRNMSYDPSSHVGEFEKSNGVHLFSYHELDEATNHFDSSKELGDGGFGTVYYGKLKDGRVVAVKRLYENNFKRVEQFLNEVEILTRLRHKHLVSLYGCTSRHSRELLLVYEYVSNGTVADHLHGPRSKPGKLPWHTRMKIAIETATALSYLHASDIIHRDVKTNNILLDEHFCVKVADFGLSRLFPTDVTHVSTAPQGTPGYVDPDYHQCYQLTDKSDVYSFGVVLIELISSMPAVDIARHRHEINLANLAINKIQNKALGELVDPDLGFGSDRRVRRMVEAVAELAFGCLQGEKDSRPSMAEAMECLNRIQSSEGWNNEEKIGEEVIVSDGVVLLKSTDSLSPDSTIMNWSTSNDTTPNASM